MLRVRVRCGCMRTWSAAGAVRCGRAGAAGAGAGTAGGAASTSSAGRLSPVWGSPCEGVAAGASVVGWSGVDIVQVGGAREEAGHTDASLALSLTRLSLILADSTYSKLKVVELKVRISPLTAFPHNPCS